MAGVTPQGFEAKRLSEILDDAEAQLLTVVDPVSGQTLQPDFTSSDPAMQVVKVPLDAVGVAWEMQQLTSTQFDPNKAVGAFLRSLVQLNGLTAQEAVASTVGYIFSGPIATPIPAGTLVSDLMNTTQWRLNTATIIGSLGTATVTLQNTQVGPISAAPNTLTQLATPIPGVTGTNPDSAIEGRLPENDTLLRQRRARSTFAPSASPVESVYSNTANIPGVTYARIYQNNDLETDLRGIPGKTIAPVIVGGDDEDIAFTLLERSGIVASFFGDESKTLTDIQGESYVIRWTRPDPVDIYVAMQIRITDPVNFPADGIQQIKDAILLYAEGGAPALGVDDGFSDVGFPPGSTVIQSRLYTPANFVPGHQVVTLFIGVAPAPTTEDSIVVAWNKFPRFTDANISITVLP